MGTIWHITFGTFGARLHGGDRITADRKNNTRGQHFVATKPQRAQYERVLMSRDPVSLTWSQRLTIERAAPAMCARGGWLCLTQAAGADHVHLLIEAPAEIDGKTIRRLIKRWFSQLLNERFGRCERWWAEGGSTRVINDEHYLHNVIAYIGRQRAMVVDRAGDGPARSEDAPGRSEDGERVG